MYDEDWDAEPVTKNTSSNGMGFDGSNQNSSSAKQGFGGGGVKNRMGLGRGRFNSYKPNPDADDSWNSGGDKKKASNGFGDSGGFGNPGKSNGFGASDETCDECGAKGHSGWDCPGSAPPGGNFSTNKRNDFGKSDDGFGSSGGFGSRNNYGSGDFGSKPRGKGCFKCGEEGHMSRDCPSGGGGGRRKGCFKCGEEGHMSRDCPKADDGNSFGSRPRGKGCFKCGEEGHMSRDCPSGGGGGGRSKGCFTCGEEGHMSRDCPNGDNRRGSNRNAGFGSNNTSSWDNNSRSNRGFGSNDDFGSRGSNNKDFDNSWDEPSDNQNKGFGGSGGGFRSRNMDNDSMWDKPPTNRRNQSFADDDGFGSSSNFNSWDNKSNDFGSKPRGKGCFKCGEEGHMSRDCPSGGGGGGRRKGCFKCGEEGHMSRDCPNDGDGGFGSSKPRGRGCFKCGEEGHRAFECPNADYSDGSSKPRGKGCFKCGEEGHISRDCPQAGDDKGDRPPLYIPPPPPEDEVEMFMSMQRGINFGKYDSIPVEVTGNNPPRSISSFQEAALTETIMANVAKARYEKPTPVQKYSIPIVNNDRDLMACAQTGSGKTAAFLLPVLSKMIKNGLESSSFSGKQLPQAIVVGPTRELVNQIYYEARKFAHGTICRPCVAYGGTSVGHQLNAIQRGCNMLIATPGRLMGFISQGKIGLDAVEYVILDEADRMLDMGFEEEIRRLVDSPGMKSKSERHTLMFSATFPDEIQKLAHDFLKEDFLFLTVGRVGGACSDVTQTIIQVDQGDKREKLIELIADVAETRSRTLVFVETKRSADFLACSLSQSDYPTTSIHGDRLQREREEALSDFKKGVCPILIATSVAARGLDIPKVEHVVNYDMPKEIDEYVHRIGRTGRCGNLGRATSFYDDSKDAEIARSLIKVLSESMQEVPAWLEGCAESAIGTSFGKDRGGFGGRDARSNNRRGGGGRRDEGFGDSGGFGSRTTGDYDYNDGGGFGGGGGGGGNFSTNDAEESWD